MAIDLVKPESIGRFISVVAGSDPYAAIKAGTLAFYRLEADGTDSSGNGRTITWSGGTPTFAAGKVNNAATFNGATYGTRAAILSSGSFWINFWAKWTSSSFGGLIAQCNDGGLAAGTFAIDSTYGDGTKPRITVRNAVTNVSVTWASATNDGNWHMIDAWYDGTTTVSINVDNSGTPVTGALTGPAAFDATPFQLMSAFAAGGFISAGSLDNILVANIAPSAAQRTLMWNGGAGYQLY